MSGKLIKSIKKSSLHNTVKVLVQELYPNFVIQEERRVQTADGAKLPVDILIPAMKVAIECQGIQHYQFTPHFHKTPQDLLDQQARDTAKANGIKAAGWSLVVVRYDEQLTRSKLARKILKAIQEN